MRLIVLPHPALDWSSKIKWFFYITCWLRPFKRRKVARAICRDWVLSLSDEQLKALCEQPAYKKLVGMVRETV